MTQLVRAPARRAGDSGSNPGPGENFSLKLLISDLNVLRKLVDFNKVRLQGQL